ncbi:MAG: alcohol dehydrogenase catalytic domain-containing protein [Calditrichia bacterium]
MKALLFREMNKIFFTELPDFLPAADEVLIEVEYAGICGTDLHILSGEFPAASPLVPGHEFCGRIVSAGRNVNHVAPGQLAAVDPNNFCGYCSACRKGSFQFCENLKPVGVGRHGAWAQSCIVPKEQVYPVPAGIAASWGALCEPLSCILHGWDWLQPVAESSSVLILGCGIIGLLWGLVLRHLGLMDFVFSEPALHRRKIAAEIGCRAFAPHELPAGGSYDIVIDCSGNPAAIELALPLLRPGGKFLFFGVCPEDSKIAIPPHQIFKKELILLGSVINPLTFSRAVQLIEKIQMPVEKLGVRFFRLEDYDAALQAARSGEVTRAMFTPHAE